MAMASCKLTARILGSSSELDHVAAEQREPGIVQTIHMGRFLRCGSGNATWGGE